MITFQETEEDVFKEIRERIEQKRGRVANRGADYLAYILIDFLVDKYYSVLDEIDLFS